MADSLIEVSSLTVHMGKWDVLREVNFNIHRGDFLAVVGPNGAGKTTLCRCLLRLCPYDGNIAVMGRDLAKWQRRDLARHLGYVPQKSVDLPDFTVSQFVMMGRFAHLSPFSIPTRKDNDAVHDAMERTSTVAFADRLYRTLSGGEARKVAIASALAQEAEVLVLDEPAAFLDPNQRDEIWELLVDLNRNAGISCIVITHDLNHASMASGLILALRHGKIAFSGHGRDLMNEKMLRRIYDRKFILHPHPDTGMPMILPSKVLP